MRGRNSQLSAREPGARPRSAPAPSTTYALRYDDDITGLQCYVLGKVAAVYHVVVVERHRHLAAIVGVSQDLDVAERGERRRTPGHAERLHHIDPGIDDEVAGLVHLADDIDAVAIDLLHGDRHHRIGDEAGEPLPDHLLKLLDTLVARIDLPAQRESEGAIRLHEHLALQLRLLPY